MSDYFDQQGNPAKPEGLHPLGQPDARYPVFYAESVPNGLRVMSEFFAALAARDDHLARARLDEFAALARSRGVPVAVRAVDDHRDVARERPRAPIEHRLQRPLPASR